MAIDWSPAALAALYRISARIAAFTGEPAAQAWRQRVSDRLELAHDFPFASRRVPEFDVETYREVFEAAYRIHYLVVPGGIQVVTIFHGAMQLEE